jgi:hypothetical protein
MLQTDTSRNSTIESSAKNTAVHQDTKKRRPSFRQQRDSREEFLLTITRGFACGLDPNLVFQYPSYAYRNWASKLPDRRLRAAVERGIRTRMDLSRSESGIVMTARCIGLRHIESYRVHLIGLSAEIMVTGEIPDPANCRLDFLRV